MRNSRLFEGDMILSKDQQERAEEELDIDGSRHKSHVEIKIVAKRSRKI